MITIVVVARGEEDEAESGMGSCHVHGTYSTLH